MATKYFFWALLLVTCGYALWRGRKYEQLSALVFITATVASVLARTSGHDRYLAVERSDLVIDTLVLAGATLDADLDTAGATFAVASIRTVKINGDFEDADTVQRPTHETTVA